MRQLIFIILVFATIQGSAQNIYIQPEIGYGITNAHIKDYYSTPLSTSSVGSYHYQISVGKTLGHLVWGTGLSFLRTGFEHTVSNIPDPYGSTAQYGKYNWYFYHLALPLYAGYTFSVGKRIRVTPAIGPEIAYNLGGSVQQPGEQTTNHVDDFTANHNTLSIFGMARINVAFRLSKQLSIVLAPEALYMLTNFYATPGNIAGSATQRNYAYLFNAGIKWRFAKKETAPKKKAAK